MRANATCAGDCAGDGAVTVDDLVVIVSIVNGAAALAACPAADANGDDTAAIDDVVVAVSNALESCPPEEPSGCDVQAGKLDRTFGHGGGVTTAWGDGAEARGVAVQTDGKIIAAGSRVSAGNRDFAVARYRADGVLDPSFGHGGLVTTDIGTGDDFGYALALQSDGRILVAGFAPIDRNEDFALVRYNPDGSLDPTFGRDGIVTTAIGPDHDEAFALALQPDGKIVLVGASLMDGGRNWDVSLARYNPDGSLDPSFGRSGKVTTPLGTAGDFLTTVTLQRDLKIVAAGSVANDPDTDLVLLRYNADGSPDTTFGSHGRAVTPVDAGEDEAHAVTVLEDGRLLVAGNASNGHDRDVLLVRYAASGDLDPAFGNGGSVVTSVGVGMDDGLGMRALADGRIVVGGFTQGTRDKDLLVLQFTADATLDRHFACDGITSIDFGVGNDLGMALAVQPDGKILLTGSARHGGSNTVALIRLVGANGP